MNEDDIIDHIPTDGEIIDIIESLKKELRYFESLLKLNKAGRKEALIYMCGLLHFPEYRYGAQQRCLKVKKAQDQAKQ